MERIWKRTYIHIYLYAYIDIYLNHSAIHQKHSVNQPYFNNKLNLKNTSQNTIKKQKERYLGLLSCLLGIYNILHYSLR